MSRQLSVDCLNEIFEYLGEDRTTLHSCLLVNHFWCEVSVRIFWRSICNYHTLISCLPNESKEILCKKKIITLTTISKPPLFNYISFIRSISIQDIDNLIENNLKNNQIATPQSLDYNKYIIMQEIFKMFMKQIPSLKKINFYFESNIPNMPYTLYPGATDCLKNLTELNCNSDIYPEFFYQLSQVCHNIQSLDIILEKVISNGLTDLISVQKNLKYLYILQSFDCEDLTNIISSLMKLPNTLIKLDLDGYYIPLSFITNFTNLQHLALSFDDNNPFDDFSELQDATFPKLQILKFKFACPRYEFLVKFLENNGKYLKEFQIDDSNNSLNLAIIKFCPNLKILSTLILDRELKMLKEIFNNCQHLESIRIRCSGNYLKEKELLEVIASHSPKNFYELKLYYILGVKSELLPEELESFFVSWMNRVPMKSFSLIIINCLNKNSLDKDEGNMNIIKKYIKLGVIKKFKS